jgi:hypothetical protein
MPASEPFEIEGSSGKVPDGYAVTPTLATARDRRR